MAAGTCWKATSHPTWSHQSLAGRTEVTTETLLSQFLLYFLDEVTEEEEELIHNKSIPSSRGFQKAWEDAAPDSRGFLRPSYPPVRALGWSGPPGSPRVTCAAVKRKNSGECARAKE